MQIPDRSDFATFMVDKPYGYYYVFGEDLVEGMPTTDRVWWFIWHVPSGIFAVPDNTNELFRAEFTNNQLWAWRKIAFCDKPQEFDLPLADGLEPIEPCRYSKDQFGRVLVNIDCKPTTGSVSIGENQSLSIGTLPEGFRPAHYTSNACEVIVGQSRYIGTFDINEYGALTLWTAAPSASIIIGSVLFDTA